jgi:nitrogenase-associated protein
MADVVFYAKPGCLSNAKQKQLLAGLGHRLSVRDLLAEPWTAARLRPFFGDRPVPDWFNPSAPVIKSGVLDPWALDEADALALMVADPLLIRRPLIEALDLRCAGFEPGPMLDALGVQLPASADLQSCSREAGQPSCDALPASAPGDRLTAPLAAEADPR